MRTAGDAAKEIVLTPMEERIMRLLCARGDRGERPATIGAEVHPKPNGHGARSPQGAALMVAPQLHRLRKLGLIKRKDWLAQSSNLLVPTALGAVWVDQRPEENWLYRRLREASERVAKWPKAQRDAIVYKYEPPKQEQ